MRPELSHKELLELVHYDLDTGFFTWKTPAKNRKVGARGGAPCCCKASGRTHRLIKIKGGAWKEHRLAFFYVAGRWPHELIDHIDGDASNNAFTNLREVSRAENSKNQKLFKPNASGASGVKKTKAGRWHVTIGINGKATYVGTYDSFEEAVSKRRELEAEYGYHPNHGKTAEERKQYASQN